MATCIVRAAKAPFAPFYLNRVAIVNTVANLLAVPLMGIFIMPLAIILFVLMPFGLEKLALILMG
mgnify:CR=1 FL=1